MSHQNPPPQRLKDRYRLVEHLGAGGMATVYRAYDETLDRDVAIKFLAPERTDSSARFLREARAVARLSHPNIMALYDVGEEGGWLYLVLEHIAGQNLHKLLVETGAALAVGDALHIIREALAGLGYAHEHGIIHRDVKPENIMVTPAGQVKVADFGLALMEGDVRLTREDSFVGSVLYMAPETVTARSVDARADLYAVGAVLYELLTGQPPFVGDTNLSVISQIIQNPVPPPRAANQHISEVLEDIVLKLLAKTPDDRYPSAQAVLAVLPDPKDAEAFAAAEVERTTIERQSLTLLERIVRSTSTSHTRPPQAADEDEALLALSEGEAAPLLVYAALEDTTAALEAERRRLAGLLESSVIGQLNLLLSQANAYEQTIGANPARMAVSVLASLARQVLQQVRDLETNLHPTILESLGLEPALETLASQQMRAHGVQITLAVQRMRERLPPQIELALFRATQDALDHAVRQAHASQITLRLERRDEQVIFTFTDNGVSTSDDVLRATRQRIEGLGGRFTVQASGRGGFELTVQFSLQPPVQITEREMDVLVLLAEGMSNKEIAAALYISPRTVKFHLDNLYSKLAVNSRTEAAIYALRQGWVRRTPVQPD